MQHLADKPTRPIGRYECGVCVACVWAMLNKFIEKLGCCDEYIE